VKLFIEIDAFYDNQIDPFIPEWWANETLAILYESMVASQLVNRDFEPYFNKFGDIVNTRRPREFVGKRKAKGDAVTTQDAIADNIQVRLDQWNHVSFIIDDIEAVMSMKKLQDEYAIPAGKALARMADQMILGQYPRFLPNMAGALGGLSGQAVKDGLIDLGRVMDDNKAYDEGRNLVLSTKTKSDLLKPEFFTSAEKTGDGGKALRTALLGEKFNLNIYKSNNMPNVAVGNTKRSFQINNAAGYIVGDTALTVDTGTGEITVGTWVEIGGFPYQVASRTGTAPTTAVVLTYGLRAAAADNAVVSVYTPGAVNFAAGYAAGWAKPIVIDGFTVAPRVGQFITFGSNVTDRYTVIQVSGLTSILLDRALDTAIADDATVNIGPPGAYNLCVHKDAVTMAIRGLAPVIGGAGALSHTASDNGLSVRVTISYDAEYQRHRWTFDYLAGIQVLDANLGAVLLG
jgi:hypothetical protein